jgi:hypothetical protein
MGGKGERACHYKKTPRAVGISNGATFYFIRATLGGMSDKTARACHETASLRVYSNFAQQYARARHGVFHKSRISGQFSEWYARMRVMECFQMEC